jgi:protein SCO1/2
MRLLLLIPILFCIAGCSRDEQKSEVVTYSLTGEVVKIDRGKGRLTVAHDDIPGFMDPMTMPFRVKDSSLFEGLAVGDTIAATLVVGRHESWLEAIIVAGRGEPEPLRPEDIAPVRTFEVGETLPDPSFVDQEGHSFRLSSLRGKAVAVTFIYTSCPLPDFCIRMTDHFAQTQKALARNRALRDEWHLVSVSFDPERDIPAVLKAYATSHGADLATWTFATAPRAELSDFLAGFGLFFSDAQAGVIDHNLRTIVIDSNGRLARVFGGNDWTPKELAEALRAAG